LAGKLLRLGLVQVQMFENRRIARMSKGQGKQQRKKISTISLFAHHDGTSLLIIICKGGLPGFENVEF
jgi:hypothetical protein